MYGKVKQMTNTCNSYNSISFVHKRYNLIFNVCLCISFELIECGWEWRKWQRCAFGYTSHMRGLIEAKFHFHKSECLINVDWTSYTLHFAFENDCLVSLNVFFHFLEKKNNKLTTSITIVKLIIRIYNNVLLCVLVIFVCSGLCVAANKNSHSNWNVN